MNTQTTKPFLIQGRARAHPSGVSHSVYYPADNVTEVGQCYLLPPEQIEQVEQAALQGFEAYRHTLPSRRSEILWTLASLLQKNAKALAELITQETGKPISLSRDEVARAVSLCKGYAGAVEQNSAGQVHQLEGRVARVQPFPIGPVLAITPYNFPLNLAVHKLAPAIATGCSLTLKPSPQTPLTALRLGELAIEAGYTAISVIPTTNEVAEALVRSDAFAKVSFTGSAKVGWHLKNIAGRKRVSLELGGNAAVIVEDFSEPLEEIAARIAYGAFAFAGQSCISVQRILVNQRLLEDFQPALVTAMRALKVGDPMKSDTVVGPLISLQDVQRTRNLIKEAIFAGANVIYGGNTYNTFTINPTLMDRTTPDMAVNAEEVFAPLATLSTYDTFDEALTRVNDSAYGLQTGVYVSDWRLAEQAFRTLEVGGVNINDIPGFRADLLPYGGVKGSGIGKEGVLAGFREYTLEKTLLLKEQSS